MYIIETIFSYTYTISSSRRRGCKPVQLFRCPPKSTWARIHIEVNHLDAGRLCTHTVSYSVISPVEKSLSLPRLGEGILRSKRLLSRRRRSEDLPAIRF